MASLDYEMPWIRAAVPDTVLRVVELRAPEETVLKRVRRREVGSGLEYQTRRSVEQSRLMEQEPVGDGLVVETSGRSVSDVAREIIVRCGWSS